MAAETLTFKIGDREYPMVPMTSLTIDEREIVMDMSGVVEEDFLGAENDTPQDLDRRALDIWKNPRYKRALLTVAYMRGNEDATDEEVQKAVGKVVWSDATAHWPASLEDDEAGPLELTSVPEESSPTRTESPSEPGGEPSTNGSDEPASPLENTGVGKSDISSPQSALTT